MQRFHYNEIESTNSQARVLANAHPGMQLLVTAIRQTAGRGRHGRAWQSPEGGAWMSLIWPMQREARHYGAVSLAVAVGVRRALSEVVGEAAPDLHVKWPNDLLIADRKVAGILCELVPGGIDECHGFLIIGIGVNVDFDPARLAADLRHPATTLSASIGRLVEVEDVIAAVSRQLTGVMEVFEHEGLSETLLAELRANLAYIGTERTWNSPRGMVAGRVLGVDTRGACC